MSIRDFVWHRGTSVQRRIGWYVGHLTRRRCRNCGGRPIYSWRGEWRPYDYLCESCTRDPEVSWDLSERDMQSVPTKGG